MEAQTRVLGPKGPVLILDIEVCYEVTTESHLHGVGMNMGGV